MAVPIANVRAVLPEVVAAIISIAIPTPDKAKSLVMHISIKPGATAVASACTTALACLGIQIIQIPRIHPKFFVFFHNANISIKHLPVNAVEYNL